MSDSECEQVKNLAKKNGLKESVAGFEDQAYKGEIEDALKQAGIQAKIVYIKIFIVILRGVCIIFLFQMVLNWTLNACQPWKI